MNKDSLIKAREIITKVLDGSDILTVDKLELIINLNILLSEDNYEKDMQVLRENQAKKTR
jgi:hypothetical protein